MVGTTGAKVYAELVGRPGLYAFVTADKSARYFLGVTFKHRLLPTSPWLRSLTWTLRGVPTWLPLCRPLPTPTGSRTASTTCFPPFGLRSIYRASERPPLPEGFPGFA